MAPLPVDAVLPQLIDALRRSPSAVLEAPPGAGKTTRVPGALLDSGLCGDGRVVMLEPRRVAARAAARRIAEERGVSLGREVGYHVRFERRASAETRILVVTEGLLVRMLQDDPFLEGVGAVVLDEFHERSLHADLSLAMVRRVQRDVRPDLRIVVMSATLDPGPLAAFLDAPVVRSEGRMYPVAFRYLRTPESRPIPEAAASLVREALANTSGNVLVFLPGVGEIHRTAERLTGVGAEIHKLYGDLPPAEQDAVLKPGGPRKIVLATNVAETSLTVPGTTAVVDSGFARIRRRDPATGLDRLERVRIPRASADQRAGRAGRESEGVCWRMWTEREQAALDDRLDAEIRRVDLAGPYLELACWGERDPSHFPWFEPPPTEALEGARRLLEDLGAITDSGVTEIGRTMVRWPVHPRLGRMLIEAHRRGQPARGAILAALLSDRDRFRPTADTPTRSDALERIDAFLAVRAGRHDPRLEREGVVSTGRVADQLASMLAEHLGAVPRGDDPDDAILRAVLAGWPDRVVRRRDGDGRRGVLVGGRGVRLDAKSMVDAPYFVALDLDAGERGRHAEAVVRVASAVESEWLRTETEVMARFDDATERVVVVRQQRYRDLVLSEAPVPTAERERVAEALQVAATTRIDAAFGTATEDVAGFLARVHCFVQWMPEHEFPLFDKAFLAERLPELCAGCRSFGDTRARAVEVLASALSWKQREILDREVPERIFVPSGSAVRIAYELGRPPVLAVRMQELFGLPETPRVAGGRVRVLLHLLAPNHHPQQITDDLRGFWLNTWPEVRKELRARYPRHSWPEDPWNAPPERRPRPRPR